MQIIKDIPTWKSLRKTITSHSIALVPTMGNLHAGHESLLKRARQENDIVILSLFVNPTQFNDQKDFENYPKTWEEDVHLATHAGVDYILAPENEAIYPDQYHFRVTENNVSQMLEGKFRPGHFDGVLTIVMKLFCLTQPHRAYFGEKDFQQLHLVKQLVEAFFLNIDIIPCQTIRNDQLLALSSRNRRLTLEQQKLAAQLPKCLMSGNDQQAIRAELEHLGFKVDYVEKWMGRLLAAVHLSNVRLIDNVESSHVS